MSLEQNLLMLIWVLAILLMTFGVPCGRRHSFWIAFLTGQGLAWIVEILLLKFRILSYPIREFPKASDLSITLEILLVPLCCALYVIYEPKHSWAARVRHLAIWTAGITVLDRAIANFSNLQDNIHFYWWFAMLVFGVKLITSNAVVYWFFHDPSLLRRDRSGI